MTEIKFKNRKPDFKKLSAFGFVKTDSDHTYRVCFADRQMTLTVTVSDSGKIFTEVIDNYSGEEYVLHLIADAAGAFVSRVKAEYESILDEISAKCFEVEVFKSKQAKELMSYIAASYRDELEYLWQKFPDNAVVRRKDNQKWYAALLTVSRRKLGFDSDEPVEIVDLRIKPEELSDTVDNVKYFPGYHMNKKHWITVCLDGTVSCEEIFKRLDESYRLAKK